MPVLCANYNDCCCKCHVHRNRESFISIKEFSDRLSKQLPRDLLQLKQSLKTQLQSCWDEVNNMFKDQESRIDAMVIGLMKRFGKGSVTVIRSYK